MGKVLFDFYKGYEDYECITFVRKKQRKEELFQIWEGFLGFIMEGEDKTTEIGNYEEIYFNSFDDYKLEKLNDCIKQFKSINLKKLDLIKDAGPNLRERVSKVLEKLIIFLNEALEKKYEVYLRFD